MLHVHVEPADPKFVEHLLNSFLTGRRLFRATNPAEVVVALVARALLVFVDQAEDDQVLFDVGRHRIRWSGCHDSIHARLVRERNQICTAARHLLGINPANATVGAISTRLASVVARIR